MVLLLAVSDEEWGRRLEKRERCKFEERDWMWEEISYYCEWRKEREDQAVCLGMGERKGFFSSFLPYIGNYVFSRQS